MTTATVRKNNNRINRDRVFPIVNTIILVLLMFITLYPVINTVAYSFNDGTDALRGGIGLRPVAPGVQHKELYFHSLG